ncbi:MAG: hypothetical protein NTV34_12090, partial [Proteobacteria bacterium]|nr:hypothetical protein [Pseudomonadota bacterium]
CREWGTKKFWPSFFRSGIRTISHIDIFQSNSMIEMLFHSPKNRQLYRIQLTNFDAVEKGVDFYLTETNISTPHSALNCATPEEIVRGSWTVNKIADLTEKLAAPNS